MSKAIIAAAAALLFAMTGLATAGPSYESRGYGGPLGVGPNFHSGGQSPSYGSGYSKKKSYRKRRVNRRTKKRNAKTSDPVETAPQKKSPAETAANKKEVESENSTISSASPGKDAPGAKAAPAETAAVESTVASENSTISRTEPDRDAGAADAKDVPKTTENVGCKKFFPSAGMTLSVPCE